MAPQSRGISADFRCGSSPDMTMRSRTGSPFLYGGQLSAKTQYLPATLCAVAVGVTEELRDGVTVGPTGEALAVGIGVAVILGVSVEVNVSAGLGVAVGVEVGVFIGLGIDVDVITSGVWVGGIGADNTKSQLVPASMDLHISLGVTTYIVVGYCGLTTMLLMGSENVFSFSHLFVAFARP